jgi:hypothetical protein
MPSWSIVVIVIVAALVVLVAVLGGPDLYRYLRMRRM